MILTFIGFSGSGKSHYSKELKRLYNWDHLDCDQLIMQELNKRENLKLKSLPEVARWHGSPQDADFSRRDSLFLEIEDHIMNQLISGFEKTKNTVIDTSGSFVLLPETTIAKFKKNTKLVYFQYEQEDMTQMIEQYFKDPKPVLWQHLYRPLPGEDYQKSIKRCYVNLVDYRKKLYEKYADLKINISFKTREEFKIKNLLEILKQNEIL